jgi:hypothetical protein
MLEKCVSHGVSHVNVCVRSKTTKNKNKKIPPNNNKEEAPLAVWLRPLTNLEVPCGAGA